MEPKPQSEEYRAFPAPLGLIAALPRIFLNVDRRFLTRLKSCPFKAVKDKCGSFGSWAARSAAHFAQDDILFLLLRMAALGAARFERGFAADLIFEKIGLGSPGFHPGLFSFPPCGRVWARLCRGFCFLKNGRAIKAGDGEQRTGIRKARISHPGIIGAWRPAIDMV